MCCKENSFSENKELSCRCSSGRSDFQRRSGFDSRTQYLSDFFWTLANLEMIQGCFRARRAPKHLPYQQQITKSFRRIRKHFVVLESKPFAFGIQIFRKNTCIKVPYSLKSCFLFSTKNAYDSAHFYFSAVKVLEILAGRFTWLVELAYYVFFFRSFLQAFGHCHHTSQVKFVFCEELTVSRSIKVGSLITIFTGTFKRPQRGYEKKKKEVETESCTHLLLYVIFYRARIWLHTLIYTHALYWR